MGTRGLRICALSALIVVWNSPANAGAQEQGAGSDVPPEIRAQGRQLQERALAHVEAQQWALAADTYRQVYELGREHGVARAPVALWDMGLALMRTPGREADARAAFRRFLDESTTLTDDPQVRDWRSTAVEHIAELDARLGRSSELNAPGDAPTNGSEVPVEPRGDGLTAPESAMTTRISPVGPVVLGLGGVVAVTGAVIGGVVLAQDGTLAAMCSGGHCPEASRPLANEIERLALTSDVLVISGATIALTGILLTILVRDEVPTETPNITAGCGLVGCQLTARF